MNARAIGYWLTTILIAFAMLSGGVVYLMRVPQVVAGVTALGYPAYLVTILGVWKLLGGIAIVVPDFARLKEWAYAGIVFDLTGASASSLATHAESWHVVVPLALAVVAMLSWALRPESRRLMRG